MTLDEARTIKQLARADNISIAELIRVALLGKVGQAGQRPTFVLGQDLVDRIVAGRKFTNIRIDAPIDRS